MPKKTGIYKSTKQYNKDTQKYTYEKRELTQKEVKSYIMKVNNWTTEQYNKKYDILRNKLRSYEAFERASGVSKETQSVSKLLYKEAKAKEHYGTNYKPSVKMRELQNFTSISSGKTLQKALTKGRYKNIRSSRYDRETYINFEKFINSIDKAREIWNTVKDPVRKRKALEDFAEKLHVKIDEEGKATEEQPEPFENSGEITNSDIEIDFDIDAYI